MDNNNSTLLEDVQNCIEEHLDDNQFSIGTICLYVGLSERQLQRSLKKIINQTPIQFVRSVRLQRAKEMLLDQPDKISDIAFHTGFFSPSYFSKCFKAEFGISPTDFIQEKESKSEIL